MDSKQINSALALSFLAFAFSITIVGFSNTNVIDAPIEDEAQNLFCAYADTVVVRGEWIEITKEDFILMSIDCAQNIDASTGIPSSVILSQAILESDAGNSYLARNCNNYFGHKCFADECPKGHCKIRADDNKDDRFLVYASKQESFAAHARMLRRGRYKALSGNYRNWAFGLQRKGYATDTIYAVKLIGIINQWKLHQYDRKEFIEADTDGSDQFRRASVQEQHRHRMGR